MLFFTLTCLYNSFVSGNLLKGVLVALIPVVHKAKSNILLLELRESSTRCTFAKKNINGRK